VIDTDKIDQEVQALERPDLEGLRALWRRRWGAPPKLRSRELMAYAAAHRLQAEAFGDLAPAVSRRLGDLARRFTADRNFQPTAGPALAPGCSLVREWGGARHEVGVLEDGFGYDGQRFTSLSAVAAHITGVKRSGLLFFGLKGMGSGGR
jgi:hypothetical protein